MAEKGVEVKALETYQPLIELDQFFKTMYLLTGTNFMSVKTYCDLFSLTEEETLEAILIMNLVESMVS